jgi:acyl-CoA thioesterase
MSPEDPISLARSAAQRITEADKVIPLLGIVIDDVGPGQATASMTITETMINGIGIVHGGLIFLLADTAFAVACNSHGVAAVARSGEIEFLQPARLGERLRATAVERRRLARGGIYDVAVTSESGTAIAEFRGHSRNSRPRDQDGQR